MQTRKTREILSIRVQFFFHYSGVPMQLEKTKKEFIDHLYMTHDGVR